jgi:hypothetical protein
MGATLLFSVEARGLALVFDIYADREVSGDRANFSTMGTCIFKFLTDNNDRITDSSRFIVQTTDNRRWISYRIVNRMLEVYLVTSNAWTLGHLIIREANRMSVGNRLVNLINHTNPYPAASPVITNVEELNLTQLPIRRLDVHQIENIPNLRQELNNRSRSIRFFTNANHTNFGIHMFSIPWRGLKMKFDVIFYQQTDTDLDDRVTSGTCIINFTMNATARITECSKFIVQSTNNRRFIEYRIVGSMLEVWLRAFDRYTVGFITIHGVTTANNMTSATDAINNLTVMVNPVPTNTPHITDTTILNSLVRLPMVNTNPDLPTINAVFDLVYPIGSIYSGRTLFSTGSWVFEGVMGSSQASGSIGNTQYMCDIICNGSRYCTVDFFFINNWADFNNVVTIDLSNLFGVWYNDMSPYTINSRWLSNHSAGFQSGGMRLDTIQLRSSVSSTNVASLTLSDGRRIRASPIITLTVHGGAVSGGIQQGAPTVLNASFTCFIASTATLFGLTNHNFTGVWRRNA